MQAKRRLIKNSGLSKAQKDFLNTYFEVNPNPNIQERAYIACQSLISEKKIRNWFQNRRARERGDCKASPCLSTFNGNASESYISKVHPTSNDLYIRR
ncbi:homeobox protein HD-9 [Encephalitozoon romaleae SJ-2008]|uniref:Homeobox protein HD-9 n=1 Tax=Encephalitozoon romaleae (strain SJ-2008) TaxID=1178016 RepID=I7AM43_ENCRO|nr:homeobox protein HD-9 [Encephalitozoon romaleae SJ-2008]AFN82749.1 homeobox protein HD-9 [Encephalitozoon romaleae SJ-2008]